MSVRFRIYDKGTLDTYIEDTQDLYDDGEPKTYWFGENEDFCDLFEKLNELADENERLIEDNLGLALKNELLEANDDTYRKEFQKLHRLVLDKEFEKIIDNTIMGKYKHIL